MLPVSWVQDIFKPCPDDAVVFVIIECFKNKSEWFCTQNSNELNYCRMFVSSFQNVFTQNVVCVFLNVNNHNNNNSENFVIMTHTHSPASHDTNHLCVLFGQEKKRNINRD